LEPVGKLPALPACARRSRLCCLYLEGPQSERFFDEQIDSGAKPGVRLDRQAFREAIQTYYEMMGWDENGVPRPGTLYDHHLEWTLD
jgi:aldehyde:ferredoxin oxidoreductase